MRVRKTMAFVIDVLLLAPIFFIFGKWLRFIIEGALAIMASYYFENNLYMQFVMVMRSIFIHNQYNLAIITFFLVYCFINLPLLLFCQSTLGQTIVGLKVERTHQVSLAKEGYRLFYFFNLIYFITLSIGFIMLFVSGEISELIDILKENRSIIPIVVAVVVVDSLFTLRKNRSFLHTIEGRRVIASDLPREKRIALALYWFVIGVFLFIMLIV